MNLFAILSLGFILGTRHATDPDHVVAVTTIVSGHRNVRGAALVGAAWGLGHTLTILLVGSGIILFKWVIPPRLGLAMEMAVAVMLIVLGLANLTGTMRWIRRRRRKETLAQVHSHAHSRGDYGRPLVVGIVHGLAGSAAIALLVLATIQTPLWSVAYLLIFGIGTIAGMMLITAAISVPFVLGGGQFARLQRNLRVASGLISLGFGLVVAYQIGRIDGLFRAELHWTPK